MSAPPCLLFPAAGSFSSILCAAFSAVSCVFLPLGHQCFCADAITQSIELPAISEARQNVVIQYPLEIARNPPNCDACGSQVRQAIRRS